MYHLRRSIFYVVVFIIFVFALFLFRGIENTESKLKQKQVEIFTKKQGLYRLYVADYNILCGDSVEVSKEYIFLKSEKKVYYIPFNNFYCLVKNDYDLTKTNNCKYTVYTNFDWRALYSVWGADSVEVNDNVYILLNNGERTLINKKYVLFSEQNKK